MRVVVVSVLLVLASAGAAPEAIAQQTSAAAQISVEAQRVARGLEAQYQAALIRERRLADDRELRLIADYEARLTQARQRADSRAAGAQAELERARADYAQLVETIALRDAASRAEIEAYRAEARGLAAEASPERLAALQRFADGDRLGAWPVLEALRIAEDRAIEAASNARRAVRWRQDAELREIMRVNGEATAADVLALWDEAARLDPRDFWTHIYRARLARTLNRLDAALSAARAALAATTDRRERTAATDEIGDVLIARNDLEGALTNYREGLEIARALYAADRSNAERARDVSVSLNKIGDVLIARNDLEGALTNYREGLELRRALYAADRSNAERARDVYVSLWKIAQAGGGTWADVVVAMEDARNRGLFNGARDEQFYQRARSLASHEQANR
jgi:tetratricopeptide (TPR) repeat protein